MGEIGTDGIGAGARVARYSLTVMLSEVEAPLTLPFSLTLAKIRGPSTSLRSAQDDK
jgi:hypothetical protein